MATLGENRRVPQVQIRDLRDDFCEFVLSDTDPSVANALRRIMLVEVSALISNNLLSSTTANL